ncbi:MAG: cadherin-like domain-containing protein [Pseudomonadota bacterium]
MPPTQDNDVVGAGSVGTSKGHAVISADAIFEGKILNAQVVEVFGEVRGQIETGHLIVHQSGHVFGSSRSTSANIAGQAEGELIVKELCTIQATGNVAGDVRYGRLALLEGANLEAHMRNIPPELGGDFELVVQRGEAVAVTTADLTAFDPDDQPSDLTFTVSNVTTGHLARKAARGAPLASFTQAELETGDVLFVHNASATGDGQFDVVVSDAAGATSGAARTVRVKIVG